MLIKLLADQRLEKLLTGVCDCSKLNIGQHLRSFDLAFFAVGISYPGTDILTSHAAKLILIKRF